ncbi:TKL family protein kinase [Tritrichomonas foetus]|uniref:TKL family protein kinase n=1 Tax=Tritrichomonas foetus TaxID=1144522 RepID=A0A1J4K3B2_9EUKA|nr:TKL family protein kinase [Tritrichomonas foetus]|eukprot:OHT05929.1 TKL family protein kinase [Tritrichomonas foetus]
MAFPLPDFDDDVSDQVEDGSLTSIADLPVENPFCSQSDYTFNKPTSRNLLYDSSHLIYSTASCKVYIAKNSVDKPTFYALKSSSFVKRIRNEFDIYQLIGNHPTIISCYDTWIQKGVAFLQLELAPLGSIRRDLFNFDNDTIWTIFSHVIFAIKRLHEIGHMHLDISPSNILHCQSLESTKFQPRSVSSNSNPIQKVSQIARTSKTNSHGKTAPKTPNMKSNNAENENFHVFKLADFGTALKIGDFDEDCEGAGPYVSPEALAFPNTDFEVGSPTDIYSFGVVMLELTTKRLAPRASQPGYSKLRDGTYDFDSLQLPREFAFIKRMLDPNPTRRPTADELVRMDRVQEILDQLFDEKARRIGQIRGQKVGPAAAVTPSIPQNRLPPETPYTSKYAVKRKIMFDDDDL